MPLTIESVDFVNSIRFPVPFKLCDLTHADVELLKDGAYTEPWENILPVLNPRQVDADLLAFQMQYHQLLEEALAQAGGFAKIPLVTIMRTILGKPKQRPGKATPMDFLKILERCKTQSHEDLRKILEHAWANSGLPEALIMILFGDGQLVMREGQPTLGTRAPSRHPPHTCHATLVSGARDQMRLPGRALPNRGNIYGVGPFHEHAHFCMIMTCAFWWCLIWFTTAALSLKKVRPDAKDLEQGNYEHHFTHHRVITVAIYAFLLQDVDYPPPSMLLSNPEFSWPCEPRRWNRTPQVPEDRWRAGAAIPTKRSSGRG